MRPNLNQAMRPCAPRITVLCLTFMAMTAVAEPVPAPSSRLVYFNGTHLGLVKERIRLKDAWFLERYASLLAAADKALTVKADPVVDKSRVPPSGDKHDYLSLAPYWWPDPQKKDGLPWIARDGEVNPMTRGADTDQTRLSGLFDCVEKLAFAYYFSGDPKYARKAVELIRIWFVDKATKVNPNADFGQGVPGLSDGKPSGIIEWAGIASVVTAVQMLEGTGELPEEMRTTVQEWLNAYLAWLVTSPLGVKDDAGTQNHANWYDYQVVGLSLYLGKTEAARVRCEAAKSRRIAAQIEPDGSQPRELSRTKSVNYSSMNLWAMTKVAEMARQVGVDLWGYETADGRSLKRAYGYLAPFVLGKQTWTYQQITSGGATKAIAENLKPLFSRGGTVLGVTLIPAEAGVAQTLPALSALQYPPLERLPEAGIRARNALRQVRIAAFELRADGIRIIPDRGPVEASLADLQGRILFRAALSDQATLPISGGPGRYFLSLATQGDKAVFKVAIPPAR